MDLLSKINQIPKPLLFFVVISIGMAYFVYDRPLEDGCDLDSKNFAREIRGILRPYQTKKGVQPALISAQKEQCRDGNSPGACENYFKSLKTISEAINRVRPECLKKVTADMSNLIPESRSGLKTLALVAWGSRPPEDSSRRLGWLSQTEIYTFCRLKTFLQGQLTAEEYNPFRDSIYEEYPDALPSDVTAEKFIDMDRPRALKSSANPSGRLTKEEVFQRSLFSIRCDLYY